MMKDEYYEGCRRARACDSLKNYAAALLIGFGMGAAGLFYVQRMQAERPKREFVQDFDGSVALAPKEEEPFRYFNIEKGKNNDSRHYAVIRNKTLDGTPYEFRRPIDSDAIEGLVACIERSLRYDRRSSYDPPEYRDLIEKLPDMDVSGDAKTITRTDVSRAYDRARGGLKAIIGEQ